MSNTNAKTQSNLKALNVVPHCKLKSIVERDGVMVWETVCECLYTPRAIAEMARANGITDSVWVFWMAGKELWSVSGEYAKEI